MFSQSYIFSDFAVNIDRAEGEVKGTHVSRTHPCLPYSNLKKSRTEKNWLLSMRSRDSLQGK